MNPELIFEIATPLGFIVRCTRAYWEFIVTQKHPALTGREQDIAQVLTDPDEVRRSRLDRSVYLFGVGLAGFALSCAARTGLAS